MARTKQTVRTVSVPTRKEVEAAWSAAKRQQSNVVVRKHKASKRQQPTKRSDGEVVVSSPRDVENVAARSSDQCFDLGEGRLVRDPRTGAYMFGDNDDDMKDAMVLLRQSSEHALVRMRNVWNKYMPLSVQEGGRFSENALMAIQAKLKRGRDGSVALSKLHPRMVELGYRRVGESGLYCHLVVPPVDLEAVSSLTDLPSDVLCYFYYSLVVMPRETRFQETVGRRERERNLRSIEEELVDVRRRLAEEEKGATSGDGFPTEDQVREARGVLAGDSSRSSAGAIATNYQEPPSTDGPRPDNKSDAGSDGLKERVRAALQAFDEASIRQIVADQGKNSLTVARVAVEMDRTGFAHVILEDFAREDGGFAVFGNEEEVEEALQLLAETEDADMDHEELFGEEDDEEHGRTARSGSLGAFRVVT